jgi:hypothetical protein
LSGIWNFSDYSYKHQKSNIMTRKKFLKAAIILAIVGIMGGSSVAYYLFNMPQRDVSGAKADFSVSGSELVLEYLTDGTLANQKYLASDGNSKIIEVSGVVGQISEGFDGQILVLLKGNGEKAGVNCYFGKETVNALASLKEGEPITVKGVIRSGASFDEEMGIYEHVVLEKCSLILN